MFRYASHAKEAPLSSGLGLRVYGFRGLGFRGTEFRGVGGEFGLWVYGLEGFNLGLWFVVQETQQKDAIIARSFRLGNIPLS